MSKTPVTCIYFMYDKQGDLLYIGKTINLRSRLHQHFNGLQVDEPWKPDVDRDNIKFIRLPCELDIELYETYYINKLQPKYNKSKLFSSKGSCIVLPDILDKMEVFSLRKTRKERLHSVDQVIETTAFKEVAELHLKGGLSSEQVAKINPDIKDAYELLGEKKMRALGFNPTRVRAALDCVRPERQLTVQDEVYKKFTPETFYSLKQIKTELQAIYDKLGLQRKAKATDLSKWFSICPKKVAQSNGYYLTT